MKPLARSVLALFLSMLLTGWVWATLAQTPAAARPAATPEGSLRPLENLLQPDGTLDLKTGFSGNLDPAGWTLASGPGLAPRFVHSPQARPGTESAAPDAPEAIGDALWDDRFDALGLDSFAYAMAISGSDVYVGGAFTAAGPVTTANHIARWNSVAGSWSALGGGVNGEVYALAVTGTQVYVGGNFTAASGVTGTKGLARWDGAAWSALGRGITGTVYAIAVSGNDVYVGGWFTTLVDGVPGTLHLAKWNGASWSALGNGVNGPVYALAASGGDVYVGGSFTSAGGVSNTMGIAKWNGASGWSALGHGITGTAKAIAVSGDDVYVGGSFTSASGVPGTTNIARWSSSAGWSALGNGADGQVQALAASGSKVYAGGAFTTVGPAKTTRIALWDNATKTWSALGSGVSSAVNALGIGVDGVYVAGTFASVAPDLAFVGKPSLYFGLWHTTIPDPDDNWDPTFGMPGVSGGGDVRAIAISGTNVYFGGSFSNIGGISATNVAKWNPATGWSPLGNGVYTRPGGGSHIVYAIAVNGNDVYVGGGFEGAFNGTIPVPGTHNIARWDGNAWSRLSWGLAAGSGVSAIAVAPDGVYVGGGSTVTGYNCDPNDPVLHGCPVSSHQILRWNGSWSTLGDGLTGGGVYALAVSGTDVYVGGTFNLAYNSSVISLTANDIAKWNSATGWTALISGTNNGVTGPYGGVDTLAISGGDVYAGGVFIYAGGMAVNRIARWDGSRWWRLGNDVAGAFVWALATSGNDVYVGHYGSTVFNADGSTVVDNGIAKWNRMTNAWSPLGTGVNFPAVGAIGIGPDGLYIGGGNFTAAGYKPAIHIGLWHLLTGSIAGRVLDPNNAPVPGARVFACVSPAGRPCGWGARTDAQGNYRVAGLPDGQYQLFAYPPSGACLLSGTRGPVTITNGSSVVGQDIQLGAVQGIPPGTSITPSSGACMPVVNWNTPLTLSTQGCPGGAASYQLLSGSTVIRSGSMTEGPAGRYSATIAPLHPNHGYATVVITIQCPSGPPQVITFTIFIDPSGYVRTIHGTPVVSATVTLYTFDNALGDFAVVPDGDSIMSPANRADPSFTDANGHFGWDVIAGIYKVRAEKAGCVAPGNPSQAYVESALLIIPPPMTDLDLRLGCNERLMYLPLILR